MKFFCSGLVEKPGCYLRFVGYVPAGPDQSVNTCVVLGLGSKPLFYPLTQFWCPLAHKPACVRFPWRVLGHLQGLFPLILPAKGRQWLPTQTLHRIGKVRMSEKKDQMSAVPQASATGCQQQSPGTPFQCSHTQVTDKWNCVPETALENSC